MSKYKNLKEELDKTFLDLKKKKFNNEDNTNLVAAIGKDILDSLIPVLEKIAENNRLSQSELRQILSEIKFDIPKTEIPEIDTNNLEEAIRDSISQAFGNIRIPEPKVSVNVPPLDIRALAAKISMPHEMDIKGWVRLQGIDLDHPLPVQLRDKDGKPVNLFENLTTMISGGGGGGGKHDYFTIKGFGASAFADYLNSDNRLKVSMETGGAGLTDTELRATAVPVSQVSGSVWSTAVIDIFGSTATGVFNADNRIKVSVETGGSGLTDAELRASAVPVHQVSGASWSTYITGALNSLLAGYENPDNRIKVELPTGASGLTDTELRATAVPVMQVSGAKWSTEATIVGTVPVSATDLDVRDLNVAQDEVLVHQVSGSRWSTEATQGTSPWVVSATDLDIRDLDFAQDDVSIYQVSGHRFSTEATQSGTWNITNITNSIAATLLNGDGNSLDPRDRTWTISETLVVSGALDTTKSSGIARQTNPTAVSDGDNQRIATDDLGRQLTRPMQVRDLTITAYATLTNGTETTLLAASAGSLHDLIYVMGANNSDVAVTVNLRPVTAGNIVMSIQIPANGTAGVSLAVPYPQSGSDTGNNWTADMADITGTSVYLSALFSREI